MTQQKIVMPLKKLAFSSSSSVMFKRSSRSSKYLRILAHAQSNNACKPNILIYDLKGLTADIFIELAIWLKAPFAALLIPRAQSFQDGREKEKEAERNGMESGVTAVGISHVLCTDTSISILAMLMQKSI